MMASMTSVRHFLKYLKILSTAQFLCFMPVIIPCIQILLRPATHWILTPRRFFNAPLLISFFVIPTMRRPNHTVIERQSTKSNTVGRDVALILIWNVESLWNWYPKLGPPREDKTITIMDDVNEKRRWMMRLPLSRKTLKQR